MKGEKKEDNNQIIDLREGSRISGYTSDHLARLVRTGKVKGIARKWRRNSFFPRGGVARDALLQDISAIRNERGEDAIVTLHEASLLSGYTSDHLARLVRTGKIKGVRVGRSWLITKRELAHYIKDISAVKKRERILRDDLLRSAKADKPKQQFSSLDEVVKLKSDLARTRKSFEVKTQRIEHFVAAQLTASMDAHRGMRIASTAASLLSLLLVAYAVIALYGYVPVPGSASQSPETLAGFSESNPDSLGLKSRDTIAVTSKLLDSLFQIPQALVYDTRERTTNAVFTSVNTFMFGPEDRTPQGSLAQGFKQGWNKAKGAYLALDRRFSNFLGDQYIRIAETVGYMR